MAFKIALAALTVTAALSGAAITQASAATMNCSVPNAVKCTIQSFKGIKSVKIQSNTGQGTINVVNKSYNGCPSRVTVGWDSAYSMSNSQIVECSGNLQLKPTTGRFKSKSTYKSN